MKLWPRWLRRARELPDADRPSVVAPQYKRRQIFVQDVTLDMSKLPRWKPTLTHDRPEVERD